MGSEMCIRDRFVCGVDAEVLWHGGELQRYIKTSPFRVLCLMCPKITCSFPQLCLNELVYCQSLKVKRKSEVSTVIGTVELSPGSYIEVMSHLENIGTSEVCSSVTHELSRALLSEHLVLFRAQFSFISPTNPRICSQSWLKVSQPLSTNAKVGFVLSFVC